MPYTEPHWLITIGGTAWAQTETWQLGIRARVEGGANQPVDQQLLANALATPTQTFFTAAELGISANVSLRWIKAASINSDGHYSYTTAPGLYTYVTPPVGANSSNVVPQQTLAVTTLTAEARGRASKGRFYLPACYRAVTSTGLISSADADAIESVARTWLLAINGTAQVSSVAVMSKLGEGTTHNITAVGVGRVFDTMRSRRRSLPETRTPLAL